MDAKSVLYVKSTRELAHSGDVCNELITSLIDNQWVLMAITIISAYVMNAEIPLFSLKIKNFSFQKYKLQIGFLAASVLMLVTLNFLAIPLIIIVYVLLSVGNNLMVKE